MDSVTKNGETGQPANHPTHSAAGRMPPRDRRIYANYFRERLSELELSPKYEAARDLADRLRQTIEELEEGLDEAVNPRRGDVAEEGR